MALHRGPGASALALTVGLGFCSTITWKGFFLLHSAAHLHAEVPIFSSGLVPDFLYSAFWIISCQLSSNPSTFSFKILLLYFIKIKLSFHLIISFYLFLHSILISRRQYFIMFLQIFIVFCFQDFLFLLSLCSLALPFLNIVFLFILF